MKAVETANEEPRFSTVPPSIRERAVRDVYDHEFLRGSQFDLGISKGSLINCLGALYWGADCADDLCMALGSKSSEEKSSRDVSGRDKEKKRELCARITVEHVVTVGQVRMHYFQAPLDKIKDEDFIAAALCPVAVITKDAEKLLKRGKTKKDSQWPREHPFERYVPKGSEEIRVVTFDGQPVDPGTWTWDDHWKLIGRSDRLKPLRDKLSDISETRWQLP